MHTITKPNLILLVEDSEDDAFFFRRTVEKSGISCLLEHVRDGGEAVEFLQKCCNSGPHELPQVIFLDLKMPVLNGFDVLEWMRTQTFPTPIQVIVLSGSEHHSDKVRATELGASSYLVKPLKVSD